MRVLLACEESQAVCKEFRALGHEAYSHDILESSDKEIRILNRFYGTASYDNSYQHLEYWGNEYNWKHFEENLKYQEMINGSVANELNFLELIEIELVDC